MKCIYCGHSTGYRQRQSGTCSHCNHAFAFEPKTNAFRLTDKRFMTAIEDVSDHDTLYFTQRQLQYALLRRINRHDWRSAVVSLAIASIAGIFVAIFFSAPLSLSGGSRMAFMVLVLSIAMLIGLIGFASARLSIDPSNLALLSRHHMSGYLERWESVHRPVSMLLQPLESTPAAAEGPDQPELRDYTYSNLLVTDNEPLARMLIANGFHLINGCAVVSTSGYPHESFDLLLERHRENPDLTVYALHSASVSGCLLPVTLREERWFPDPDTRIVDLGLRPGQIGLLRIPTPGRRTMATLRNMTQWRGGRLFNAIVLTGPRVVVPESLRKVLRPDEVDWLEKGNFVELEFISPSRLMNSIRAALRRPENLTTEEGEPGESLPFLVFSLDGFGDLSFDTDFG